MSRTGPVTILAASLIEPEEPAAGGRDDAAGERQLAFPDVSAALSYAKQLQRDREASGVRVGIDVGHEGGPAAPQVVAAELCARAERGQVLVSHAAHAPAAGRPGYEFREVGTLELDGLDEPVLTWELLWLEPESGTRIRLCGPLELVVDGRELATRVPGGQAGALLRYLLANRDRGADRQELIGILWPGRPPKDPQADLRVVLSRLRRALAPARLDGRRRGDPGDPGGSSRRQGPALGDRAGAVRGGARPARGGFPARSRRRVD